jgi:hypothetical protein
MKTINAYKAADYAERLKNEGREVEFTWKFIDAETKEYTVKERND